MQDVIWSGRPKLRRPVMVCAFKGWNDAGEAASAAVSFIRESFDAEDVASIDPEEFFDFTAVRPTVRLTEGRTREIDWPSATVSAAEVPGAEGDLVVFQATEPSLRWRRYTDNLVATARELDVRMVVTLGALLADVPHTRPAPVTGSASDQALVEQLGLQLSRYEGPTGIVGVLHDAFRNAGVPSVSLWAAVPHYVSLAPSPKAALALCKRLGQLLEVRIETKELAEAAESYQQQVTEAGATDEETAAYVEELEQRADAITEESIPSGDSLAAELTRFLREREDDGGGDAARGQ
jgi:proteasome assembly chaperone (PAC2) family protein